MPREDVDALIAGFGAKHVVEGTVEFETYRQNILRDAERSYYLSLVTYRRAHTLMMMASAFWAHVTLYYSSWFAARTIIACFGGWVGLKRFVEVVHEAAGAQTVRGSLNAKGLGGSHQSFWKTFYASVGSLKSIVAPEWLPALDPVSSNPIWQIETRNRVNYQIEVARIVQFNHAQTFDPSRFPASLSGDIATQYDITKYMLGAAAQFLVEMAVTTDEFASRQTALTNEVWNIVPTDVVVAADARFLI